VNRLDVVGMIVSPRPSHTARADVVRYDVTVIREPFLAEGADAILSADFPVHQLSHFGVRAEFSISTRVLRIINAADSYLSHMPSFRNGFPAAASNGTMNWAQLVSSQSHNMLLGEFGMVCEGFVRFNEEADQQNIESGLGSSQCIGITDTDLRRSIANV
jgi:hypothetical protein